MFTHVVALEDKRGEMFKPPPVVVLPFSGAGMAVGSSAPSAVPVQSTSSHGVVQVDQSKPITTIQVRFSDGKRVPLKLNHESTVADLYALVDQHLNVQPGSVRKFMLSLGFPPHSPLSDMEATLKSVGLINAIVIQKPL